MSQSGINSLTSPPARTASPLSTRIAAAVPNIMSFNLYLEVRAISINWVLSPISAMNSVKNTFKNNNIFLISPLSYDDVNCICRIKCNHSESFNFSDFLLSSCKYPYTHCKCDKYTQINDILSNYADRTDC